VCTNRDVRKMSLVISHQLIVDYFFRAVISSGVTFENNSFTHFIVFSHAFQLFSLSTVVHYVTSVGQRTPKGAIHMHCLSPVCDITLPSGGRRELRLI
jgi:hypothetical protein